MTSRPYRYKIQVNEKDRQELSADQIMLEWTAWGELYRSIRPSEVKTRHPFDPLQAIWDYLEEKETSCLS